MDKIRTKIKDIPDGCMQCKGKCFNPKDNLAQQRAAHSLLGKQIPNCCVKLCTESVSDCPYKDSI